MNIEIKTQLNLEVLSREVVITNEQEYLQAGDVLKLCKKKVKELDEERKTYTAPLDESKKLIMAKFKETTEPLEKYIDKLSKVMAEYFVIEEKKRQEEQKRLEAEAINNAKPEDCDVIVPVVESLKTSKGSISTTSMVKSYEFEIVNELEIPREYLMVDESKIKKAINAGVKEMKGILIKEVYKPKSR